MILTGLRGVGKTVLLGRFRSIAEAPREVGRGVVLLLDEVQLLTRPQLEALIAIIHKTV